MGIITSDDSGSTRKGANLSDSTEIIRLKPTDASRDEK